MRRSLSASTAAVILCAFAAIAGMFARADEQPARTPPSVEPGEVKIADVALPEAAPKRDVEAEILAALDKGIAISADKVPLKVLMQRLSRHFDIPIVINETALVDEGVEIDVPISIDVSRVSLQNALKLMLEPQQLRIVVETGVLKVTTAAEAVNERRIRIFNVSDLLSDPHDLLAADRFIEVIQNSTGGEPDGPWLDVDGEGGTMQLFQDRGSRLLVVRQTEAVFEEVEDFLHRLRETRKRPAIERPAEKPSPDPDGSVPSKVSVRFYDVSEFFRVPAEASKPFDFTNLIGLISKLLPAENPEATMAGIDLLGRPILAVRELPDRQDQIQLVLNELSRVRKRSARPQGPVRPIGLVPFGMGSIPDQPRRP